MDGEKIKVGTQEGRNATNNNYSGALEMWGGSDDANSLNKGITIGV